MKHLHKLGATKFNDQYLAVHVSAYLLSVRLKSVAADPKELSEKLNVSVKSAQRYIYNSYAHRGLCLNALERCLNIMDISLSSFFKDVDTFISGKYHIALYDLETDTLSFYTEDEYSSLILDEEVLIRSISERTRLINKCGLSLGKEAVISLDNAISKFPSELIKEHSHAIPK